MRLVMCPALGCFTMQEQKRYQIALTKTGKLQFYKVTPFTDLAALRWKIDNLWQAVTVIYAYSQQEARDKAKKFFREIKEQRR